MAVRHSDDLVRPYRIFKAIDKESSYYREEVEVVCVQWTISQITYLKEVKPLRASQRGLLPARGV